MSTARSIVVLGVAALALGLVASGNKLKAWAQERERTGLRGSVAAQGAASVDNADKSKSGKKAVKGARRPAPVTAKSVNAKFTGQTRGEVAKAVQAPVAVLSERPAELARLLRKRKVEEDPYAPLGLRLGGLTVLPVHRG